jgi:hypothetical protein
LFIDPRSKDTRQHCNANQRYCSTTGLNQAPAQSLPLQEQPKSYACAQQQSRRKEKARGK